MGKESCGHPLVKCTEDTGFPIPDKVSKLSISIFYPFFSQESMTLGTGTMNYGDGTYYTG